MFASPILSLIREFQKLPGVGEKTATRFALYVLKASAGEISALSRALVEVKEKIRLCSHCFQTTETDPCEICASPKRNRRVVCVVEDQAALLAIERARSYFGVYHVLGGRLSPMDGVGPDHLRIRELLDRVRSQGLEEVVLATNPNVEGEATALFLKKSLEPLGVRVTRIARGVPVGADLEFTDALTLGRALESRNDY